MICINLYNIICDTICEDKTLGCTKVPFPSTCHIFNKIFEIIIKQLDEIHFRYGDLKSKYVLGVISLNVIFTEYNEHSVKLTSESERFMELRKDTLMLMSFLLDWLDTKNYTGILISGYLSGKIGRNHIQQT